MTSKQFLSRYLEINREVAALKEECTCLRSLAEQVGGGQLNGMPKGTKQEPHAAYTVAIEKIIIKEQDICRRINEMLLVRNEIENIINSLPDETLRALLRYRYICGWTWERIAAELNYTYQWVYTLHIRALKQIIIDSNL